MSALSPTTARVTLSVGSNDIGFVYSLSMCAVSSAGCTTSYAMTKAKNVQETLVSLYRDILIKAPNANLYVFAYPLPFNDSVAKCGKLTISQANRKALNQVGATLNTSIKGAVDSSGARAFFVDTNPQFNGHRLCDPTPWILDSTHLTRSFHPTDAGYSAMVEAFMASGSPK
jgi:lysophospholipase L1-like esterase